MCANNLCKSKCLDSRISIDVEEINNYEVINAFIGWVTHIKTTNIVRLLCKNRVGW